MPDSPLVGHWRAELGPHAMYEATVYEFQRDGSLSKLDSIATYSTAEDFAVVMIYFPSSKVRCGLEGRWQAQDATLLLIETTCSNGQSHRIALELDWTPSENAFGARLISVDGQQDWWPQEGMGSRWPWSFTRCEPRDCLPDWDVP